MLSVVRRKLLRQLPLRGRRVFDQHLGLWRACSTMITLGAPQPRKRTYENARSLKLSLKQHHTEEALDSRLKLLWKSKSFVWRQPEVEFPLRSE